MMKFPWKVRTWLIFTLLCGNLLVFAFSWYSLHRSRQQYEQSAQTLSRNIAQAVNQEVSDGVEKINLALHTLTDELEDQLTENGIDKKVMIAYMTRHEQRMPQIEAFRVSNAAGQVILGKGLDSA
jgi:lipopolysaccharide biosynthesis regulator YciM